jgi:hypothetical protein
MNVDLVKSLPAHASAPGDLPPNAVAPVVENRPGRAGAGRWGRGSWEPLCGRWTWENVDPRTV